MNPAAAQSAHDRVGPYQLIKAIGAGGSARVDLARIDRAYNFQRHVVIKRPLEHLRGDAKAGESLRREARLGGRLRHPNLVSVLDAGRQDGYDYLVLEYVHGGSLRTFMQHDDSARVHDVPLEVALAIVRDVARGLHEAHELADETGAPLGLVHRDVSPGNVLIGTDGAVKLADFGIAKETRVATLSGSMHGTVTYMAPEQCRGHAFDRRADIFSLGVILYELVTGQRLFWADNDVASLHRVLAGNVPRARKVKQGIAPVLDDLIMSAVAHDPMKRLPTAKAFADELENFGSAAGLVLAARHVAGWVHDLMGPREVPWIGATTVVEQIVEPPPPPLVDLIAAEPNDEPLPAPTFGPTDASAPVFDEIDTQPEPGTRTPKSKRRTFAAVIAVGLVAGVAGVLILSDSGTPKHAAVETPAPAPIAPTPPPPVIDEHPAHEIIPGIEEQPELMTEGTEDTPPAKDKPAKHHHHQAKPTVEQTATTVPVPTTGSDTAKAPKVEWNPSMLLPTDTGSGTKQK